MIELEVNFSQEYEVQRIVETIHRIDFYRKQKYSVRFPEILAVDFNTDVSRISDNQIIDAVKSEYIEMDYKTQQKFLFDNWTKLMNEISPELTKTDLKPDEKYIVNLTKYGVGGSYNYPNTVIANIKNSYSVGLLRTTLHEILHLNIHQWIIEYNINHWQKERVVDLLIMKLVPRLSKPQQLSINTEDIDKMFADNYPNIKTIIKKMGLIK